MFSLYFFTRWAFFHNSITIPCPTWWVDNISAKQYVTHDIFNQLYLNYHRFIVICGHLLSTNIDISNNIVQAHIIIFKQMPIRYVNKSTSDDSDVCRPKIKYANFAPRKTIIFPAPLLITVILILHSQNKNIWIIENIVKLKASRYSFFIEVSGCSINPWSSTLWKLYFHPLEVVPRYREPQLHVDENYSYLLNLRRNICTVLCLNTHFFPNNCDLKC